MSTKSPTRRSLTGGSHRAPRPLYVSLTHVICLLALIKYAFPHMTREPLAGLAPLMQYTILLQIGLVVMDTYLMLLGQHPQQSTSKRKTLLSTCFFNIMISCIIWGLATIPVHFVIVLFGAPFLAYFQHTLMLALFISLLGCVPLAQTLEFDGSRWRYLVTYQMTNLFKILRSLPHHCPLDIVMQQWFEFTGALVGAWLGAIPIPLDWDRDWQRWPTTVVVGAFLGTAFGSIAGTIYVRYFFHPSKILHLDRKSSHLKSS